MIWLAFIFPNTSIGGSILVDQHARSIGPHVDIHLSSTSSWDSLVISPWQSAENFTAARRRRYDVAVAIHCSKWTHLWFKSRTSLEWHGWNTSLQDMGLLEAWQQLLMSFCYPLKTSWVVTSYPSSSLLSLSLLKCNGIIFWRWSLFTHLFDACFSAGALQLQLLW